MKVHLEEEEAPRGISKSGIIIIHLEQEKT